MTKIVFDLDSKREPLVLDRALVRRLFKTRRPTKLIATYVLVYSFLKWQNKYPTILQTARYLNCSLKESKKRLRQLRSWLKRQECLFCVLNQKDMLKFPPFPPLGGEGTKTYKTDTSKNNLLHIQMFPKTFSTSKKFCNAWSAWLAEKRKKRGILSKRAATMQKNKLIKQDIDTAILMLETAIESGWATVYTPRKSGREAIVKQNKINIATQTLKGH